MADQILKDRMNRKLGTIKTSSTGVQTLYNAMNIKLGEYDPRTNTTKDRRGMRVGSGNLLTTLLDKK